MAPFSEADITFMSRALKNAEIAAGKGEVPVGALLVLDGRILSESFNAPISLSDPTAHAEIRVLREGGNKIGNYRLLKSELFVTLEPCMMCYGALVHARISRLVYAAPDHKTGIFSTGCFERIKDVFNHRMEIESGLMQERSAEMLKAFFKERRDAGAVERGGLENR